MSKGFISDKHKCIFIHIPRTGGTSIGSSLLNAINDPFFINLQHGGARDILLIEKYFSFCFVRNPYDRILSWYTRYIQKYPSSFEDFIKYLGQSEHSQWKMIYDENEQQLVEFIGRYENIYSDYKYICDRLNIKNDLLHLNKTNHVDYREFYTLDKRKIVENLFKKDFDMLGYLF